MHSTNIPCVVSDAFLRALSFSLSLSLCAFDSAATTLVDKQTKQVLLVSATFPVRRVNMVRPRPLLPFLADIVFRSSVEASRRRIGATCRQTSRSAALPGTASSRSSCSRTPLPRGWVSPCPRTPSLLPSHYFSYFSLFLCDCHSFAHIRVSGEVQILRREEDGFGLLNVSSVAIPHVDHGDVVLLPIGSLPDVEGSRRVLSSLSSPLSLSLPLNLCGRSLTSISTTVSGRSARRSRSASTIALSTTHTRSLLSLSLSLSVCRSACLFTYLVR